MRPWSFFALLVATAMPAWAQPDAVLYRVTFPEPEHHWLQVDATFPLVGEAPLTVRMSRSSPGRYAVHEFAKNIFAFEAYDGNARRLPAARVSPDEWRITGHDGTVRVVYKLFGDTADGTYLGVDTTHAHLNMPAAFLWAPGLEMRPIRVSFAPPAASNWQVGTQLYGTADPLTFTAPNLQYFMDSPAELSDFVVSTFQVANADGTPARFRLVVHSDGTQSDIDALAGLVARLVREHMAVFGEYPRYEPGQYTFLLDFVGSVESDGMEHRNSTSISMPGLSTRTAEGRRRALPVISHEFFHNWNTERIRPAGLEPFDLTRGNVTCCLWLAEGFTEDDGSLLLRRAGLARDMPLDAVGPVIAASARTVRSPVEMSEQAPFADAAVSNDLTDRNRTFASYYSVGAVIALGLDLSIRERSGGTRSLDDFMRRLWRDYGAPLDPRPGYVTKPYTLADLRVALADVTGDAAFANAFFDRYVEGRDVPDFARLLPLAGYALLRVAPERAWMGDVQVREGATGLEVGVSRAGNRLLVPFGSPLYAAGIDEGDVVETIDQRPATAAAWNAIVQKKPAETVTLGVRRRDGRAMTAVVTLAADPRLHVAPVEDRGAALTPAQAAFRASWLGTKVP